MKEAKPVEHPALDELLLKYTASDQVQDIYRSLEAGKQQQFLITGMKGSLPSMVLASLHQSGFNKMLILSDHHDDAAYFFSDINHLLKHEIVHFFPDSFRSPLNYERYSSENVMRRTELVNKCITMESNFVVCTYTEALLEKIISPSELDKKHIKLKVGETLDIESILELLIEFNFVRTEFVLEPGQFSLRGGIIDLFSFGSEWPYRIELFDDEIESIRQFNPMDQLSIKSLKAIRIIPHVNRSFDLSARTSLTEVIDNETLVVIPDLDNLLERWDYAYEMAFKAMKEIDVIDTEELKEALNEHTIIAKDEFLSSLETKNILLLKKPVGNIEFKKVWDWDAKPQPEFNKNFTLLIDDFNAYSSKKFSNFLFAESGKQIERFYNIFEDMDAKVDFTPIPISLSAGFVDETMKLAVYTDHQVFKRFHRYKLKRGFSKAESLNAQVIRELKKGDYVVHIDHGVGKYSGLEKIDINGNIQESVRILYKNNDILYVSIHSLHKIAKYIGKDGKAPGLNKLGSDTWTKVKNKTKKKVKDIAGELIKIYAERKMQSGFAFAKDGYLQHELEASFVYEDTPDQATATQAVKEDMCSEHPMDRLICGDVGFGKTEIAVRAAFKAVVSGKQVAILVPTTILALQHFHTFNDRLNDFDIKVDYLNRFRSTKEKKEIFKNLSEGKLDILVATHSILSAASSFVDLGLLIIDEEQKFGVSAKEKLRKIKANVDTLILTATPIPRTLQFSLMSARDMSIIRTPPPNRQAIHTEIRIFNPDLIRESILFEVNRGGQVFFVHNRVKSLPEVHVMLKRMMPDVHIRMAHGQMDPSKLEETLISFIDGKFDVLLSTNIIETGLDIANANTIIINNAQHFGLSDLHQLRGRVGRSNRKAYCYLFCPPMSSLTVDARKRLKTIEEFSDLGSGFHIAMRDLDIRGAGNLLGAEQSGFIADIGYETYQRILEEAIAELKSEKFKDLFKEEQEKKGEFVRDVIIDTDSTMLIPNRYVQNMAERLKLYTELDAIEDEKGIKAFQDKLRDRFGDIPEEVDSLFEGLRMRWIAKLLGFERIILKRNSLRLFFVENAQSLYYETSLFLNIMQFIGQEGSSMGISLKERNKRLFLVKENISELEKVTETLQAIFKGVQNKEK